MCVYVCVCPNVCMVQTKKSILLFWDGLCPWAIDYCEFVGWNPLVLGNPFFFFFS